MTPDSVELPHDSSCPSQPGGCVCVCGVGGGGGGGGGGDVCTLVIFQPEHYRLDAHVE